MYQIELHLFYPRRKKKVALSKAVYTTHEIAQEHVGDYLEEVDPDRKVETMGYRILALSLIDV